MKRIAFFLPGGVAYPSHDVHIPSLYELISRLSQDFEIVVYSLTAFRKGAMTSSCGNAIVKFVSAHNDDHWTKKILLLLRSFSRDHQTNRFHFVHGMLGVTTELAAVITSYYYHIPSTISLLGGETANIQEINYGTLRTRRLRTLMRFICHQADIVTIMTKFQLEEMKRLGMYRNDLHIIPFGVDLNAFQPFRKRIPKEPFRFLHVGSLTPVKGQELLLRTFYSIREKVNAQLRIIGADYMNGSLQALSEQLGIANDTAFMGYLNHSDLPSHYDWADVLLHTSFHEAQGVVIAEAAATRTTIAGTPVGLIADFGRDMAIIVHERNPELLAASVLDMLQQPVQLAEMRERALQWAQQYDINRTVASFRHLYLTHG